MSRTLPPVEDTARGRSVERPGQGESLEVLCEEKSVKPLAAVQAYLPKSCLRFCADRVALKDWSPILRSIAENRSLSRINIYSRSRCKRVREKVNTEDKLEKLWRCRGKDQGRPILYTNFLLRCLVDAIAVCVRDSSAITSVTLDGIPLTLKYLNILCTGLKNNQKLISLSLTRCRIGDVGCDLLLSCLRNNPNLCVLNLSSCRLTNRSAMCLSLFLKRRKADLLQNIWEQSAVQSQDDSSDRKPQGLHTLILNQNPKLGDSSVRHLIYALKSDVWLKSLSLRHCGISKRGAEMMIRLLQSNNRITKLDLTENRIPINTLQMMLRILKRRREIVENATLKKKYRIGWKRRVFRNGIGRFMEKRRKHLRNRTGRLRKYSLQKHGWKKMQRFERRMKQSKQLRVTEEDYGRRKKLGDLELQMLNLIESNYKLKEELLNNKVLLNVEAQYRSRMEDELQKISLRLNDLRSKVVMMNCLSTKICNETQLSKELKYIFEKFESFSTIKEKNGVNEEVLNTAEPLWSSPIAEQGESNVNQMLAMETSFRIPMTNFIS
ncbi:Protein Cep78 like protein [Eufriesea mexicana]|nr:Protein Cep78 like protein [Eufriesea mexicana]